MISGNGRGAKQECLETGSPIEHGDSPSRGVWWTWRARCSSVARPRSTEGPGALISEGRIGDLGRTLKSAMDVVSQAGTDGPDPDDLDYRLLGILLDPFIAPFQSR